MFFGTGEKGSRPEGVGNQSTFEGAVTKWARTLRLPRTAAAGRRTKTRAHTTTRAAAIVFFSGFLMRQYLLTKYVTGFCSMAVLYTRYPSWGTNSPPQFSRATWYRYACRLPSPTVRETWRSSLITINTECVRWFFV